MKFWLTFLLLLAVATTGIHAAEPDGGKQKKRMNRADAGISREHRLPCNGEVSLYYGNDLIWKKAAGEIRRIDNLVEVPDVDGNIPKTGWSFRWLMASMPDVKAIELESCQPRLRRFDKKMIDSDAGANLYLIATTYRGFRLHRVGKKGRGQGMKNIGKIRLIPSASAAKKMTHPDNQKQPKT